jgi:hypothetical protein
MSITGLSPSLAGHSMPFVYRPSPTSQAPRPLETCVSRFRLFPVRSPLLGESRFLSFPPGTKMFQFPGLAASRLCIHHGLVPHRHWGFPIRRSPDQSLLAAPRGLSQLSTSFIASDCLGIHHTPFVA